MSNYYHKSRPYIFWGVFFAGCTILGFFIYQELTNPLPTKPEPVNIVSDAPPHTEPPTAEAKAEHKVPPTHPKTLIIPKLSVNTNIYPVGITSEGAIDAPKTAWGVGWYENGPLPGSGPGAALLDGHVNDAFNTPGVFYALATLKSGDEIEVIRGDETKLKYHVVSTVQQPLNQVDMKKVLSSVDPYKEGLNLVTCGGKYDKNSGIYSDRIIIYAVRIS